MKAKLNRVMLVGTGSGCGKTTVTCGILKALTDRKYNTASFKCGPDYIDPMFHRQIIGTKSGNLDLYLCGENTVKYLLSEGAKGCDISVIEGVMGMYDGMGFEDDTFSANHISRVTNTPEILVVGVKGKSLSLLAELSGYLNFGENNVKGIILNSCSKGMYPVYKKMIEDRLNIKCYGHMPLLKEAEIGSRHLGLITAEEIDDIRGKVAAMGSAAEEFLDMDGIVALSETAEELEYSEISVKPVTQKSVKIAVARDKAFCFYYEDNFTLLKQLGAELIFFSPMTDEKLPEGISGLILGGGYPEEYLEELSSNASMLTEIKDAAGAGMPIYAECGGFMYLGKSIEKDGKSWPMAGAVDADFYMTTALVRFGYKELTANRDNVFCKAGEQIKCHEFHYSDVTDHGDGFTAKKASGKTWQAVHTAENLFAGYPHLHLWSNIRFAEGFVQKCSKFGGEA